MSASEAVQVYTSHSSEMVVTREIALMNRHEAAGPDILSSFFFKDGTELRKPKLTKHLGSTWVREQI